MPVKKFSSIGSSDMVNLLNAYDEVALIKVNKTLTMIMRYGEEKSNDVNP